MLRFEKKALFNARRNGGGSSSPIGSVYLEAVRIAEVAPTQSIEMLEALVALYDPFDKAREETEETEAAADEKLSKDDRRWILLARQKISEYRERTNREAQEQLPGLKERLAEAQRLARSEPTQAARMFRAIVSLYGERNWARAEVATAKQELRKLSEEKRPE